MAGGKFYEFIRRLFDIVVFASVLTVFAIPIGIIALIIYIDDKGNPFFSQIRPTKNEKTFKMYKLRTMCMDAEKRFAEVQKENRADGLAFKSDNDSYITRNGDFGRSFFFGQVTIVFKYAKRRHEHHWSPSVASM